MSFLSRRSFLLTGSVFAAPKLVRSVAAAPTEPADTFPTQDSALVRARAGGDKAKPVVAYLEKLGDADPRIESPTLTDAEAAALAGTYAYGSGSDARITIDATKGQLGFLRANATKRALAQRAPREFSPAGAPNVRIKFVMENGKATALTVHDPDVVLTARRLA